MKYFYEISNGVIRLYINGEKLMSRPTSEINGDDFIRDFMNKAVTQ